jgi:hypothetical protein
MKAFLTRLAGRKDQRGPSIIISTPGGNSLLEFRSEAESESLIRPEPAPAPSAPPVALPKPSPRPFHMTPQRDATPLVPWIVFALLMAASAAVLGIWWRDVSTAGATSPAAASDSTSAAPGATTSAPPNGVPGTRPVAKTGSIDVSSDPAGASVLIDGAPRGRTPLVIGGLPPGPHTVSVVSGTSRINRSVTVATGATATVMAAIAAPRAEAGWVAFDMPFEAEVRERGRLLGTTASPRLALPPGWHDLELSNAGLGFDATVSVQIVPGQIARPAVGAPTGLVSVNAAPWAEVLIDGRSVGTTPLANLPVAIGTHTLTFRHPQLGERTETIHVTGVAPVRVGVSMAP